MSTGLVICSLCRREVHQDGPREWHGKPDPNGTATWTHCDDHTRRCEGATSTYPRTRSEIVGPVCAADGPLPERA